MTRRALTPSADSGFTIVELLIAMLLMGIIVAPLAAAFFNGFVTTTWTNQHVENSADAQLLSSYFASDVASSDQVSKAANCADSANLSGATVQAQFAWLDPASGVYHFASYVTVPDTSASAKVHAPVWRLVRVACEATSGYDATSFTSTTTATVGRTLAAEPTARCDGADCPAGVSHPREVSWSLEEFDRDFTTGSSGAGSPDYTFTLSGTRRVNP